MINRFVGTSLLTVYACGTLSAGCLLADIGVLLVRAKS